MEVPEARWIDPEEALPPVGQLVWVRTECAWGLIGTKEALLQYDGEENAYRWKEAIGPVKSRVTGWWPLPEAVQCKTEG